MRGVEEAVDEAMMLVRRELVSPAAMVRSSTGRAFRCRRCEAVLYHHGDRKRTIVTGEGTATDNSQRYRCPSCGETSSPLDEASDLSGSRYTLRARALIAESAADFAFGDVPTRLKERGIEVGPKEVDRMAREELAGYRMAPPRLLWAGRVRRTCGCSRTARFSGGRLGAKAVSPGPAQGHSSHRMVHLRSVRTSATIRLGSPPTGRSVTV